MSGFQVGDVVVCVDDRPAPNTVYGSALPIAGKIYRVRAIGQTPRGFQRVRVSGPLLPASPDYIQQFSVKGFLPDRFHKIDKADDSFIAQVRACKPTVRATSTPSHEQEVM